MTRRDALKTGAMSLAALGFPCELDAKMQEAESAKRLQPSGKVAFADAMPIDRKALVDRHKIVIRKPDPLEPLTVGNGEMAFTADVTGLQTFPAFHQAGMPLHTMAQWAWHETPNGHDYKLVDTMENYESHGKQVPYPSQENSAAGQWLMSNPHKFDLGRLGFVLPKVGGRTAEISDLSGIHQELDLWSGVLLSHFEVAGQAVTVETILHPDRDMLSVRVISPLLKTGQLGLRMDFPGSSASWLNPGDWEHSGSHTTTATLRANGGDFVRQLDGTTLTYARALWLPETTCRQVAQHAFEWRSQGQDNLDLSFAFSAHPQREELLAFDQAKAAAVAHWKHFWGSGGAVDLSESRDPRWKELERRIVLSQYQTAVNCSGSLPPQETGLVTNSWCGKFHLEMYWWHAAHFTLWGREDLLMKSLDYYRRILPIARETAARIGCRGARWPKMVGPEGRESPNGINPFLVWQQPHPIHFAELMYQAKPNAETLELFREIVLDSAEFMASFTWWNEARGCFELGSPIVSAQEDCFPSRREAKNPTFELAYWSWSLEIAQKWRIRLGMRPSPAWERVRHHLCPLTVRDGIYAEIETPVTPIQGHPTMLAAFGLTPLTSMVDCKVMQRTLDFVLNKWNQKSTWGWDYPMMAMTAARLGRPDQAIEALFIETPKNRFLANGHNFQQLPELPLYLPGNGGLLFAIALMAAGWNGAPAIHAPGFPAPAEGWVVRQEGLRPAL
jgi:hypothetical protein